MKIVNYLIIIITSICLFSNATFFANAENKKDLKSNVEAEDLSQDIFLPMVLNHYPPQNIFGTYLENINNENDLNQMVNANMKWMRRQFHWHVMEPEEGQRNWTTMNKIENEILFANQNNVEIIAVLRQTPDWAEAPGFDCGGKIREDKLPAFASFYFDFVNRYSKAPFNIKYFELWIEPDAANTLGCWGDTGDDNFYGGKAYGEMLKIAYQAAKTANPNVEILVGGLLLDCDPALGLKNPDGSLKDCRSANFLKGILEAGAGNSFDGVNFHAYDYYQGELGKYGNANFAGSWNTTGPVTLEKSKYIRKVLQNYGFSDKYLINTEAGLLCKDCVATDQNLQITKAYYVAQEFSAALADAYNVNLWFSYFGDRNSGLFSSSNTPYPAYYAFGFTSKALENHDFVKKLTDYPNVMGFEFISKSGKRQWVLWSIDTQVHTIPLGATASSIHKIDTTGNGVPLEISTNVPIGIAPVFIKY